MLRRKSAGGALGKERLVQWNRMGRCRSASEAGPGMKIAAITVNGFRQFSSNKTMNSIEEFEGQRIRVPNVPNYIEMVEALGASPIAMSLTDLFTALEQNSVDGQDNPYPTDWANSFYEVQDYILESNHMFSPRRAC